MISFFRSLKSRRELGKKGLVGSRKRRTSDQTLASVAEHSKTLAITMLIAIWCVSVSILVFKKNEIKDYNLVEKQQAPNTEFSELPEFSYEDGQATIKKKREAMATVPLFFSVSNLRISQALKRFEQLFIFLEQHYKELQENKKLVNKNNPVLKVIEKIPPAGLTALYQLVENPAQKKNYQNRLFLVLANGVMSREDKENLKLKQKIRVIDVKDRRKQPRELVEMATPETAAEEVADGILKYYSSNDRDVFRKALIAITLYLIGPKGDLEFNNTVTQAERDIAAGKVDPVIVRYRKDQPLILKGQIITARDLDILRQYQIQLKESTKQIELWERLLRIGLICLFLMVITGIYIYHIHPEVASSNQKIWVTGTTVIFGILVNYGSLELFDFLSPILNLLPHFANDIIPLAVVSAVLSVTVGFRVAVYAGFFTSVIAAMMLNGSFNMVMNGMLVSCLVGFAVRHSLNYKSFFFRILILVSILSLMLNDQLYTNFQFSEWTPVYAFANGIGTAILALIILFVVEFLFNISTNMALLALCDYNHPLLKRLQMEAPGTFHHSLMVATLAEQAAIAIGVNPIKARVGALFHDIGKLIKPEYFTENNAADDKHRELHPRMSSLIILNHVKEGVDMAIKYKLKKIIRDAIEQHHGTDMVFYFYKRALEENNGDTPVAEGEYRYSGPLPVEKEVVLIGLADVCEAASRSLQKPTPAKIEAMVWELLRKRVRDRQMDKARITLAELGTIRDSFSKTLSTMLHGRIAYPKDNNNEDDLFVAGTKVPPAEAKTTEETD